MNKNLLDRLDRVGDSNLIVKPIYRDDDNKTLLKNFLIKQKFLNANEIFEILKINFDESQPIGYILMKDKNIVGFLGTIFSKRPIKEKIIDHCYLHSWIVLERHRLEAFKLILPIIKKIYLYLHILPLNLLWVYIKNLALKNLNFFLNLYYLFLF